MRDQASAFFRCAMPGKVESYDPATRTARIKPMLRVPYQDGDGERQAQELDAVHAVPVCWPGEVALAEGDGVLLIFCDFDIGSWRDGTGRDPADPGDETAHGPVGAVCLPGLDTSSRKAAEVSDSVALATLVGSQLTALKTAITNTVIVPNDGGASFKSTLLAALSAWPATVASTKVKVRT
jgi:hypothetical protein